MGLFGFLGKALGGVVKAGLNVATGGISDQVLGGIKSLKQKNQRVGLPLTEQNQAAIIKSKPRVIATETVMTGTPGMAVSRKPARHSAKRSGRSSPKRGRPTKRPAPKPMRHSTATSKRSGRSNVRRTGGRKGKRRPPTGGLDLAKIAKLYRAAGSPGDWRGFVQAHSNLRKAA